MINLEDKSKKSLLHSDLSAYNVFLFVRPTTASKYPGHIGRNPIPDNHLGNGPQEYPGWGQSSVILQRVGGYDLRSDLWKTGQCHEPSARGQVFYQCNNT